jgi:LacI family transcriptional regulator
MAKKRTTMKEIARELGVSRTTISLVLQGKGDEYRISRETQELVLAHVREQDYKPNFLAKALNRGRTDIIGAVFPDVFESFMGNIIRGMESVLYHQGYSLMISTSSFDQQRERLILEKMVWQGVDGIILVPVMPFQRRGDGTENRLFLSELLEKSYPLVMVDRTVPGCPTHAILQDDLKLSHRAVQSLIRGGKRKICCISFDLAACSLKARIAGYRQALSEKDLQEDIMLLHQLDPESEDMSSALMKRLSSPAPPEAFFVTTSGLADKLKWLLSQAGLSLPIVRFGEKPPYDHSDIIDIPQPHQLMGKEAALLLLEAIENPLGEKKTVVS